MMDRVLIHRETYHDSVFLMAVSARLEQEPALDAAQVLLATPANLALLHDQGFAHPDLAALGPTDLVIALRAAGEGALDQGEAQAAELLADAGAGGADGADAARPVSLEAAVQQLPGANLCLISVPGRYAAFEAHRALEQGLSVMIFSDNVSVQDEVALKERAASLGLLCMGPDCGTSLIGGKPLGFANRVGRGPVGLVGASGTGLQEVSCQLHHLGCGVSHALGVGGRDLSEAVGARATLAALDLLAAAADTRVLVVISKPPDPKVAARVVARLEALDMPAVVCFLGQRDLQVGGKVQAARTLGEAAALAAALARPGRARAAEPEVDEEVLRRVARQLPDGAGMIHGLFCGGTLAAEAALVLREQGLEVGSNLDAGHALPDPAGHTVVDLGDDRYTRGRPHPMIEPALRNDEILARAAEPGAAVLLLDLVLGAGSHPDPAGVTAEAVARAVADHPGLAVLCAITGTDLDAQGLASQREALQRAGALVFSSTAAAARAAARLVQRAAPQEVSS